MTNQNQTAAQPDVAHRHYDITNGRTGWDVRESVGLNAPWLTIAICEEFGEAQKLKNKLQAYDADQRTIARLREALEIVAACGSPERVSLYDEEAVEGWSWKHPEGNEWTEIGSWDEPPPIHPLARAVLAETAKEDKP